VVQGGGGAGVKLELGLRSDIIESRYSLEWLFKLMADLDVHYPELMGFGGMAWLKDGYFAKLRALGLVHGVCTITTSSSAGLAVRRRASPQEHGQGLRDELRVLA